LLSDASAQLAGEQKDADLNNVLPIKKAEGK
jgi:hypothetical protein